MTENIEQGFVKRASVSSFGEISKDQVLQTIAEDVEENPEEETSESEQS